MQDFYGYILAGLLFLLAVVFAWRQVQALRQLKTLENLSTEDRSYFRRQALRRLFGCALMFVLAAMMLGLFVFDILTGLDSLVEAGKKAKADGGTITEEQEDFFRYCVNYVIGMALLLLLLLIVAFVELGAIRRYGMRHRKRIRDDRRAMLQRQLPLLHRERNGDQ
jgi:ABC-type Fe3+ transport system permease subunit